MVYLKTIFLACVYFLPGTTLSTCKHKNTTSNIADGSISRISYSSSGGRSGNYEKLDITPDSLTFIQARRGVEKLIKEKTGKNSWSDFIKAINLDNFDKVKSNPGHALYDGVDVTITIEKGNEKHSIVNGNEDTANYEKLKPFTNLLESKLVELQSRILW